MKNALNYLVWLLFAGVLLGGSAPIFAQEPISQPVSDSEALMDLQQTLNQLQSASGRFEQIIREQDGYLIDRQTGNFALQKPRLLHWKIAELDQLLVSDGEYLYLYDELFAQVIVRPWSSDPAANPAAILLDDIYLGDWAQVTRSGSSMILTPFGHTTSVREMRVAMNGVFPALLTLVDVTGQVTEIRFFDVQINQPQDAALFDFAMPADAEIIYEN